MPKRPLPLLTRRTRLRGSVLTVVALAVTAACSSSPTGPRTGGWTPGTGGAELHNFVRVAPNSEARLMRHGVVRFVLKPAQVEWSFLGVDGSVADPGLDTCR